MQLQNGDLGGKEHSAPPAPGGGSWGGQLWRLAAAVLGGGCGGGGGGKTRTLSAMKAYDDSTHHAGRPGPFRLPRGLLTDGGGGGAGGGAASLSAAPSFVEDPATAPPGGGRGARPMPWLLTRGGRWLALWDHFLLLLAVYSTSIAPFEFGFYRKVPLSLLYLDIGVNVLFATDVVVAFFTAYKDQKTYTIVDEHGAIARRYLRTGFIFDVLACLPWNAFYRAADGRDGAEVLRWLDWTRLYRLFRIFDFFDRTERDTRLNYAFTRISNLFATELYVTHIGGCVFYYLATTVPSSAQGDTWIGSLVLGGNSYFDFREMDLGKRYVTSLYWAVMTLSTLGYGDIHPVNPREMVWCMIFVSFDMILGAYILGNMTALIVKGSRTDRYRARMKRLALYTSRNRLPQALRRQMRQHVRLAFETERTEDRIVDGFPTSIRHKVAHALFRDAVAACYLFCDCSHEFVNQIVAHATPECYMPQEAVIQQHDAPDNMFVVVSGRLELLEAGRGGGEEAAAAASAVGPADAIGEVAVLCNIPQPCTVRVRELVQLLRIDKAAFTAAMATYTPDGHQVIENLLQRGSAANVKVMALGTAITALIEQQEAERVMVVINAASRGDLSHLKALIRAGASPSKTDYDGRAPLHLAASRGYDDVVRFLVREQADIDARDNFGTTPLLEALRAGHDATARILVGLGATLSLQEAGSDLCNAVMAGDTAFLRRLLAHGVDPNSADYDRRTPLHVAAAEGFLLVARALVCAGADVFARDRWGHLAVDEARRCQSKPIVDLLERAMEAKAGGRVGGDHRPPAVGAAPTPPQVPAADARAAAPGRAAAPAPHPGESITSAAQERTGNGVPSGHESPGGITAGTPGGEAYGRAPRVGSVYTRVPMHMAKPPRPSREQPPNPAPPPLAPQRVTLYPYDPRSGSRGYGRLVWLPATVPEVLRMAEAAFGPPFAALVTADGGEVVSTDVILDGDRLYCVNPDD